MRRRQNSYYLAMAPGRKKNNIKILTTTRKGGGWQTLNVWLELAFKHLQAIPNLACPDLEPPVTMNTAHPRPSSPSFWTLPTCLRLQLPGFFHQLAEFNTSSLPLSGVRCPAQPQTHTHISVEKNEHQGTGWRSNVIVAGPSCPCLAGIVSAHS